jgi:hypothetical protein
MSKTSTNRISTANIILLGSLAAGTIVCAVLQNVTGVVLLGVTGVLALLGIVANLRADAPDIGRINALQYRDERDRTLARAGFSIVGAAALIISVIEAVAAAISGSQLFQMLAFGQLFVLAVIWGVANSIVVRRG